MVIPEFRVRKKRRGYIVEYSSVKVDWLGFYKTIWNPYVTYEGVKDPYYFSTKESDPYYFSTKEIAIREAQIKLKGSILICSD